MIGRPISFLILLAIVLLALLPNHAWAAGIGASPGELYFETRLAGSGKTLSVINTGDEESSYRVYAEGEYESWFDISPNEFQLAPGESIELNIAVAPPSGVSGEHTANICVISFEPSLGLQVGVGVKVPAHISVTPLTSPLHVPMVLALAVVSLTILIGIYLVWRKRKAVETQ